MLKISAAALNNYTGQIVLLPSPIFSLNMTQARSILSIQLLDPIVQLRKQLLASNIIYNGTFVGVTNFIQCYFMGRIYTG